MLDRIREGESQFPPGVAVIIEPPDLLCGSAHGTGSSDL
jgi:hypothetical protein